MLRELVYILIKDPLSPHSGPTLGMHEELCGDSGIVLGLYFKDPLNIFNKNFQLRGQKFSVKFSETAIFKFTS